MFLSSEDEEVAQPLCMEVLRVGTPSCTGREGDSALSLYLLYWQRVPWVCYVVPVFGGSRIPQIGIRVLSNLIVGSRGECSERCESRTKPFRLPLL